MCRAYISSIALTYSSFSILMALPHQVTVRRTRIIEFQSSRYTLLMSRTTFEHVWGELVHEAGTRKVQLRLTVKEMMVDETHFPVMRALARTELLSEVHDGLYKVRFLLMISGKNFRYVCKADTLWPRD